MAQIATDKTPDITFEDLLNISCNVTKNNVEFLKSQHIHVRTDSAPCDGVTGDSKNMESAPQPRLLLSANHARADMKNPVVRRCNGLILHAGRVLVWPQEIINSRPNVKNVVANWNKYAQYDIIDGTTVTMYNFDGKWCIATANGYEVNGLKWNNSDITYQSALASLFTDTKIMLEHLDPALSYTFIMRHPSIHLLHEDGRGLWLLRVCKGTNLIDLNTLPGPLKNLLRQTERTKTLSPRQINEACKNSLADYLRNQRYITYGFILRQRENTGDDLGDNANILFEGTLLKKIRQFIYNIPKGPNRPAKPRQYCILRAWLNYSQRSLFKSLFPQFLPQFSQFDKIAANAVNCIMSCMRNSVLRARLLEIHKEPHEQIAYNLLGEIERMETINTFDTTSTHILYDVIVDKKYIDLYYKIIYG